MSLLLVVIIFYVLVADQTPTPTRFLKNCEEVGLFNELTSPFEHDFKKATEDDIKKVNEPKLQCKAQRHNIIFNLPAINIDKILNPVLRNE